MFEVTEKILNSKLDQHQKWLDGEEEGYRIVLTGVSIKGYDFKGHNLSKGTFLECEFDGCTFSEANLEEVTFESSKLTDCNFRNNGSNLVSFEGSTLVSCDFMGSVLTNTRFESSTFENCDFYKSDLNRISFEASTLIGHDFSGCDLRGANFNSTKLTDANFTGAQLKLASFVTANCANANFTDAIVYKTNFMKSDLTNANLTNISVDATVGNGAEIKSLQAGGRYITWTSDYVWVDCVKAPIKPFLAFKPSNPDPLLEVIDTNSERIQSERGYNYKEALSKDTMEWVENYIAPTIAFIKKNLATKTPQ